MDDWDMLDFSLIDEMPMPTFEQPLELDTSWLDDPYANWGGGQGGDGFKVPDLASVLGKGGSSGGIMDFLKALGLVSGNGSGGLNLGSLLGLLAAGGGTLNANNASKDAAAKIEGAANKSNEFAQGQYDKAQGRLSPFIDSGLGALAQLSAGTPTLADRFVSKGTQSNLASQFGGKSLASLIKG